MRGVNPIYLLALLLLGVVLLFSMQYQSKQRLDATLQQINEAEANAKQIVALKQSWGARKQNLLNLQRLLNASQLKPTFEATLQKNKMIIRANAAQAQPLAYLLGKLLNATYKIETMQLDRLDAEHVKVYIEVSK